MPKQIPIGSQPDQWERCGPDPRRQGRVGQVQYEEIGLPAAGQAQPDGIPRIGNVQWQVHARPAEGDSVAGLALAVKTLVSKAKT